MTTEFKSWLDKKGVQCVGQGTKIKDGICTGVGCVMVGVDRKLPKDQVAKRDLIPSRTPGGLATDVVEVGVLRANPPMSRSFTNRERPIMPGASCGHPSITAGTIGGIFGHKGYPVILSNWHVLVGDTGGLGDVTLQPGAHDGGGSNDEVGTVLAFEPIQFSEQPSTCPLRHVVGLFNQGVRVANGIAKALGRASVLGELSYIQRTQAVNQMDAAITTLFPEIPYATKRGEYAEVIGFAAPQINEMVYKLGRTTEYTSGNCLMINALANVSYGAGRTATFEGQTLYDGMSQGGDSGSVIVNARKEAVGLLFAGSETSTIATPIDVVRARFGLEIL